MGFGGYRGGNPFGNRRRNLIDRFWEKVDRRGRCWLWTGCQHVHGYGRLNIDGAVVYAHRLAYEFAFGEAPADAVVMHACDEPRCVNPAHLRLGTVADNNRDKASKGRNVNPLTDALREKTHCARGHEYTPENTHYSTRRDGTKANFRRCKTCIREQWGRRVA